MLWSVWTFSRIPHPEAPAGNLDYLAAVQKPVKIAVALGTSPTSFAPFSQRTVTRHHRAAEIVTMHDHFDDVLIAPPGKLLLDAGVARLEVTDLPVQIF